MTEVRRPRVAAIGLDDSQVESIRPLCGVLRTAGNLDAYSDAWTETDILVARDLSSLRVIGDVHLLTVGTTHYGGRYVVRGREQYFTGIASTDSTNRERELSVPEACPLLYTELAGQLSKELASKQSAPPIIQVAEYCEPYQETLVETSSQHSVALRLRVVEGDWPGRPAIPGVDFVALFLPTVPNLAEWFKAFLTDIHAFDSARVPQLPPRLSVPSDWYTPEESALAERIAEIDIESHRLAVERQRIKAELADESVKADVGIRRALIEDGDELVAAVSEILSDLGFKVRNVDAGLKLNEARREDLRLTLSEEPDWEAIVEVKGYPNGTKTNDARQIREHRERYRDEKGLFPDLTVWLANPFRRMDPSSRPVAGAQVEDAAAIIGAVHVLSIDLYKQWALAKSGELDAHDVVKSLTDAEPGLWRPPTQPLDT